MPDRMSACPVCGGPKTIVNAEICGRCKIEINKIRQGLEIDYIKKRSREFYEQAKNVLRARLDKQRGIQSSGKRNIAGFIHE